MTTRTVTAFDMYAPRFGLAAAGGPARLLFRIDNDREFGILVPSGAITSIVIRDRDVAYMSVAGDGIYRSSGNWEFWQRIYTATDAKFLSFVGKKLFIRVGTKLYYSSDGIQFDAAAGIDTADIIESVAGYGERLAAASEHALYYSVNGGAAWTKVKSGLELGGTLYADTATRSIFAGANELLVSRDSGKSWQAVPTILYSSSGALYGTHDCSGVFYIGPDLRANGRLELLRSIDHGKSLQMIGAFLPQKIAKLVILDRGSTIYWLDSSGALRMNRDGIDGFILDSVASEVSVTADTGITAFACPGAVAKPFTLHMSFSECTGIKIDSVMFEGSAAFATSFTPGITVASGEVSVPCSYRADDPGYDTALVKVTFRSLLTNQTEVAYGIVTGRGVTEPAKMEVAEEQLDFGIVDTSEDAVKAIAIRNTGCDAFRIDSVVSSLPEIFAITDAGTFPLFVKGGTQITFTVTFKPRDKREYAESFELYTSEGTRYITLIGTGTYQPGTASVGAGNKQPAIRLSRNIVSDMLEVYSAYPRVVEAEIFDAAMRRTRRMTLYPMERAQADMSGLSSGLYFLVAGEYALPFYHIR